MTDEKLSFVRIAWKTGNAKGHGDWFDLAEKPTLQRWVNTMNEKYGVGSHIIEYDNGNESYQAAQAVIAKTSTNSYK